MGQPGAARPKYDLSAQWRAECDHGLLVQIGASAAGLRGYCDRYGRPSAAGWARPRRAAHDYDNGAVSNLRVSRLNAEGMDPTSPSRGSRCISCPSPWRPRRASVADPGRRMRRSCGAARLDLRVGATTTVTIRTIHLATGSRGKWDYRCFTTSAAHYGRAHRHTDRIRGRCERDKDARATGGQRKNGGGVFNVSGQHG